MSVDDVAGESFGAEQSDLPRDLTPKASLADPSEQPCQQGLTRTTVPPRLSHAARRGHSPLSATPSGFNECGHFPVASFEPDQSPRVEHQAHSRSSLTVTASGAFLEEAVGGRHFGPGEWTELVLPRGHRIGQGLETKPIPACLGEPSRDALAGSGS